MNLNIYQTYKVTITYIGAIKTYEGFENFKYTDSLEVNGGELMEWIAKRLLDNDISTFTVRHNGIKIETFNPFSGEGGTVIYEIEEVDNDK